MGFLGAIFFFLCSNTLGAVAWSRILSGCLGEREQTKKEFRFFVTSFLYATFGKYLPGNVGHFIGRFALLNKRQVQKSALASSILIESVLTVLIGGCFASIYFAPLMFDYCKSSLNTTLLYLGVPIVLMAIGVLYYLLQSEQVTMTTLRKRIIVFCRMLLVPTFLVCINYVLLGLGLFVLFDNVYSYDLLRLSSAFALAFTVGFAMPGAPAGVGVRESTFLALYGTTGQKELVLVLLLYRLSQILADGVTSLAGWRIWKIIEEK